MEVDSVVASAGYCFEEYGTLPGEINNISTARFSNDTKKDIRITTARFHGLNSTFYDIDVQKVVAVPGMLFVLLEVFKNQDKLKDLRNMQYSAELFNSASKSDQINSAVNHIYELFNETPKSLKLVSDINALFIGSTSFFDDKDKLVQKFDIDSITGYRATKMDDVLAFHNNIKSFCST